MQLLFMKDQYVVQARSPNALQKAFTDRIGSWRMIRCFQYLAILYPYCFLFFGGVSRRCALLPLLF
jgi:hypothetical protein